MVTKNSENAENSQASAAISAEAVQKGKQVVTQMLHSIEDINISNADIMTQSEASNQEISGIVKVISEIGSKTKVINDIVFQTKLLSFNASVEAARAGEHGRGFAVVAEEVGNLAQMSGNAAKEISQLLEESIRKVESTVVDTRSKIERLIAKSKERIDAGLMTAKTCGEVFDEIVTSVSDVAGMVTEIAMASREQSQGVQEITKAMGQMDQVTQQNTFATQQAASAAEQLTSQAGLLKAMVETLITTVEGSNNNNSKAFRARTKKTTAAQNLESGSVVPFKKKNAPASVAKKSFLTFKRAVGAEDIPAENDPRFEDV
jgi:methyl-accepting chemotaxis protein